MNSETLKKLSIEKFDKKLILNIPEDIVDFEGINFENTICNEKYDLIFTFIFSLDEFTNRVKTVIEKGLLNPNGVLYFAYPKKGNKQYKEYIGRDDFFQAADMDSDGYVFKSSIKFNKMVAFNEVFTVIGLKHEEKKKKNTQPSQCVGDYVERIPDIRKYFEKNSEVLTFFDQLTPGYQRDWARYVFGVKNPATTEKRFSEMENILKQGYKSVDLYRRSANNSISKFILSAILVIFSLTAILAQNAGVTVSGVIRSKADREVLPYTSVILKTENGDNFIMGVVSGDDGRFSLSNIKQGNYTIEYSFLGFTTVKQPLYIGNLSQFLDMGTIEMSEDVNLLDEVVVTATRVEAVSRIEKKTFTMDNNINYSGGSTLQAMQSLPGVTLQEGKVQLRGSDKVAILVDGKQSALTGYDNQAGLDNIPASAIERIEIINNPSSKYDANGNAGIINIIFKKEKQEGFNGKAGMALGLGALWEKQANLPDIRPQYRNTPKVNPSLSLNYHKNKTNIFFQGDYLYTETLNKNEFVERTYNDGQTIRQQTKRNRNTGFLTTKAGVDWNISDYDMLTVSGLYGSEKIIDKGDEPFFNKDLTERFRLWRFLEDELKTTVTATTAYQHKFRQAGHLLNAGLNYTYHREDEKYFFTNIMPDFTGEDAFKLISDEHVTDLNIDYVRPHKYGRIEAGLKFRYRVIPTDMLFIPGLNTPLDVSAGGWATYRETIPALYGNYVFENNTFDVEAGMRVEYVKLRYEVNPDHPTYKSDGYDYTQPFPNVRLTWKINENNRISTFYNRRVDRPAEVDIRIFPKYDDAEIIKVGNPELQPQFTNSFELGYKTDWKGGYLYLALYDRLTNGTITRIASIVPGKTEIYNIFQNAGKSNIAGGETVFSQKISQFFSLNLNATMYYNVIDAFTVFNKYPAPSTFSAERQEIVSGNVKFNGIFYLPRQFEAQITAIYLAPDIIPQGKTGARFSLDAGVKKTIQKGRGEIFVNATDLLNTMKVRNEIQGDGFKYISTDYYETQVIRAGYTYKF